MNINTSLAIFAVLAAMALLGATATYLPIIPADAQGGPPYEKNYGQCKQTSMITLVKTKKRTKNKDRLDQ